jgi:hypothetical protein
LHTTAPDIDTLHVDAGTPINIHYATGQVEGSILDDGGSLRWYEEGGARL